MRPPASGSGGDGRQVFISFKTEDRASAARVKDALVAAGHDVWWQENIHCGREWHGDIEVTVKDGRLIPPTGGDAGRRIEPELRLQSLSVHYAGRSVSLDAGRMEVFRTATGWLAYRLRLADAPRAR